MMCGVPQGSIPGPLLFLIYINNLPSCLEYTTPRMFADDTNVSASGKNASEVQKKINHDLGNIREWLIAHRLSPNTSKTEYMFIGSDYQLANLGYVPQIHLGDMSIQRTNSSKSLGVYIDERLPWAHHIEHLAKKSLISNWGFKASSSVCPTRYIITYLSYINPISI